MKLHDLFEGKLVDKLQSVRQTNLIVISPFEDNLPDDTPGVADAYIIEDIPPITDQQFEQLMSASFEEGSVTPRRPIKRLATEDESIWERFRPYNANGPTPWKQFVEQYKADYPLHWVNAYGATDDFDE